MPSTNDVNPAPVHRLVGRNQEEFDPTGRAPSTPGAKLDAGKAPILRGVIQYFPLALSAVAEVSAHGAAKYTWKGWQTVPDGINRYGDALARHLVKENLGMQDEDSGLLHAAHAAWNALARLELIMRDIPPNRELDRAPENQK